MFSQNKESKQLYVTAEDTSAEPKCQYWDNRSRIAHITTTDLTGSTELCRGELGLATVKCDQLRPTMANCGQLRPNAPTCAHLRRTSPTAHYCFKLRATSSDGTLRGNLPPTCPNWFNRTYPIFCTRQSTALNSTRQRTSAPSHVQLNMSEPNWTH